MSRAVRVDTHVALSGVFAASVPSAVRTDEVVTGGNAAKLHSRFDVEHRLGGADAAAYLGVLELASRSEESVPAAPILHAAGDFATQPGRVARCSWRQLARAAGYAGFGASTAAQLCASLDRLAGVTQSLYERNVLLGATQWLSWERSPAGPVIVLNSRASHVLGMSLREMRADPVVFLSLDEQATLGDTEARLAHLWLSGWARPAFNRKWQIGFAKLGGHIWRDRPDGTTGGRRKARLRKILERIDGLGGRWSIDVQDGMVTVRCAPLEKPSRRALPGTPTPCAATDAVAAGGSHA